MTFELEKYDLMKPSTGGFILAGGVVFLLALAGWLVNYMSVYVVVSSLVPAVVLCAIGAVNSAGIELPDLTGNRLNDEDVTRSGTIAFYVLLGAIVFDRYVGFVSEANTHVALIYVGIFTNLLLLVYYSTVANRFS